MPKLKVLSGKEVVKIFSEFGFEVVSQRGGHVRNKTDFNRSLTR